MGRLLPSAAGLHHGLQQGLQGFPAAAIKPAPLLAWPRQLLGLPLNGEIQQQRPQILNLGTTDNHAIEAVAAREPLLTEAPFPAQDQLPLFGFQLLFPQPSLQGRREAEAGLNQAPAATAPQQAGPGAALGTPQQGIQRIEQDRFTRPSFAGQHGESRLERQVQALDQGNIFKPQTREHGGFRKAGGSGPNRSGSLIRLEGGSARVKALS